MLSNWSERSVINASLLNPAFCGEVLRRAIRGYKKHNHIPFPFAASFVILPIVLHMKTRERLPKSTRGTIHAWLSENNDLKIGLPERIKSLVPYTREALLFLFYHEGITINETGELDTINYRIKKVDGQDAEEISAIYKKAEFFGSWLAKAGSIQSTLAFLGVKP